MGGAIRDIFLRATTDQMSASAVGKYRDPVAYRAIVERAEYTTIVSKRVLGDLGIGPLGRMSIEGRRVPVTVVRIGVIADTGRYWVTMVAAVSSALARRAGRDEDGRRIDVILGGDYLRLERAILRGADGPHTREGDDEACCSFGSFGRCWATTRSQPTVPTSQR